MKDIMLKIVGRQVLNSVEQEPLELVTEGKYYKKGDSLYLLYNESELSGMEGCTTSLKITGDKIKMRRFGEPISMDTEIEFEKGKRFHGFYDTPYGAIAMEVLTNSVENNLEKNEDEKKVAGNLHIDYHISLRGLTEGRSSLNIQIL